MFTIRQHKGAFEQLRFAIVGDILHSRVARSQIHALPFWGLGNTVIAQNLLRLNRASGCDCLYYMDEA